MYFEIKNNYTADDKYLAMVTENGIWIKDQFNEKILIVNAKNMINEHLNDVTITVFDNANKLKTIDTISPGVSGQIVIVTFSPFE